jgi:hypothetical protein
MGDLISFILEIYLDIKHWFNVKKRRKFEKENNLPKKIMIHPLTKVFLIFLVILIPLLILITYVNFKYTGNTKTNEKIIKITAILELGKKQFGKYPSTLKQIIRNNPLRRNITLDYWKNEFVYTLSKDSLNYTLLSLGRDNIINTSDDISSTNK